jgi:hypothetical protein
MSPTPSASSDKNCIQLRLILVVCSVKLRNAMCILVSSYDRGLNEMLPELNACLAMAGTSLKEYGKCRLTTRL